MRVLMTGLGGTVAPALASALRGAGHEVLRWRREDHPPEDPAATRALIAEAAPDWVCHLATGAPGWAEAIAATCADRGVKLLWTSSVSVFGPGQTAPLRPELEPAPGDDYGRYKREVELRVLAAHPGALVPRLGWQVGLKTGSNTFTEHFDGQARAAGGAVTVSDRWIPSCAALPDTAAALSALMAREAQGLFHLEGNPTGLSAYAIASRLSRALGLGWRVERSEDFRFDNRMADERAPIAGIAGRLAP